MNDPIEEIVSEVRTALRDNMPFALDKDFPAFSNLLRTKLTALVEKTRKEVIDEIAEWAKGEFTSDLDKIFLDDLLTTLRMREEE